MSETVFSPVKGEATLLENVNDEMFAQKMLGDGIALIPKENEFRSPVDGIVTMVYDTQHAIGITTKEGTEILIHIGIDTMELKGEPFQTKTKVGDHVAKGDLLTIINWDLIKKKGMDVIVPIIVTNKQITKQYKQGEVCVGDPLFEIE